jgi:hypothetical protein
LHSHTSVHIFVPYPPSFPLSLPLPPSHWYQPSHGQDLLIPPVVQFYRQKKKKKHFCLFEIMVDTQGVSCDNSMCICIIILIVSSPLFFFILPWFLSYGGFSWLKNSIELYGIL